MNPNVLISVIIPCFNHGRYIDDAINSIICQSYKNYEIIIVNDGSKDKYTLNKLLNYKENHINVVSIQHSGVVIARNIGIALARGEYILVLDADDYFESTFLKKSTAILNKHPEVGIVTCGIQRFEKSNLRKKSMPISRDLVDCILEKYPCGNSMFRKICWQQVGGYSNTMKDGFEDWDLWIRITSKGWKISVIPEYLFYYRQHKNSRRIKTHFTRPKLIQQLVKNHREYFQLYIDQVVFTKEEKILSLKEKNRKLINSPEYRIGKSIMHPISILVNMLKIKPK